MLNTTLGSTTTGTDEEGTAMHAYIHYDIAREIAKQHQDELIQQAARHRQARAARAAQPRSRAWRLLGDLLHRRPAWHGESVSAPVAAGC